jgi:hypothetical protein
MASRSGQGLVSPSTSPAAASFTAPQQLLEPARDAPGAAAAGLKAPRAAAVRAAGASVALLGLMPAAAPGATLAVRGTWDNHERHGWQIR